MNKTSTYRIVCCLCLILLCGPAAGIACTSFQLGHDGKFVVGFSFAFPGGSGMVVVNPSGLRKTAFVDPSQTPVRWTARFGSVTFNQIGREFPYCGMNERRLVITEMSLGATTYPASDERPAVNELQWIQYHLDTCADLAEVLTNCRKIRVAPAAAKLHYMVCDAGGKCASIAYRDGQLEIIEMAPDAPHVMTNTPYADSLPLLKDYDGFGGEKLFPVSMSSPGRFIRMSLMVKRSLTFLDAEYGLLEYASDCLPLVAQQNWQWSVVFRQADGAIWFMTRQESQSHWIQMAAIDFSCDAGIRVLDLNGMPAGDLTGSFTPYSTELNRTVSQRAFQEIKFLQGVPEPARLAMWAYPESIDCTNRVTD